MTAEALVAELRARGIALRADGDKIRYRPVSAMSAADLERLRAAKAEVLEFLASPPRPWVNLDPAAVREALGPDADEHEVAMLALDVLAAVRQIKAEIATGAIGQRPRLVRGRPLADWLQLQDVARLLRSPQGPSAAGAPPDTR